MAKSKKETKNANVKVEDLRATKNPKGGVTVPGRLKYPNITLKRG